MYCLFIELIVRVKMNQEGRGPGQGHYEKSNPEGLLFLK